MIHGLVLAACVTPLFHKDKLRDQASKQRALVTVGGWDTFVLLLLLPLLPLLVLLLAFLLVRLLLVLQVIDGLSDALARANAEYAAQAILLSPLSANDEETEDEKLTSRVMTGRCKLMLFRVFVCYVTFLN